MLHWIRMSLRTPFDLGSNLYFRRRSLRVVVVAVSTYPATRLALVAAVRGVHRLSAQRRLHAHRHHSFRLGRAGQRSADTDLGRRLRRDSKVRRYSCSWAFNAT